MAWVRHQTVSLALVSNDNRWHADIKPDNILRVQERFKLADPGFARFKKKNAKEKVPREYIFGGTETYGNFSIQLSTALSKRQ
jgi:hypothetical protein